MRDRAAGDLLGVTIPLSLPNGDLISPNFDVRRGGVDFSSEILARDFVGVNGLSPANFAPLLGLTTFLTGEDGAIPFISDEIPKKCAFFLIIAKSKS